MHKRRKQASAWRQKELGYNAKDQRLVLATEDVAEALKEVRGAWLWPAMCLLPFTFHS